MTVMKLLIPCPRIKTQNSDPFGVISFLILSFAPAASNILLINHATSIYLSNCDVLISLMELTITLFDRYVNPKPGS